ncbi:porin family protein [Chitinophaga sp. RAB17]|uniref:porin family protein n=1 Tax=Chitinophaga sp. RAB17 TaxID=3233049 RepID=UPI003F92E7D7
MKKYFLLCTAALVGSLYTQAQVTFGLKAGFSAANMSSKFEGDSGIAGGKADTKMIPAFHAGVIVDIALDDQLSLQPGLFFSQKGAKLEAVTPDLLDRPVTIKTTTRLNYLELPVNLLYKHQTGSGKLFAGLGPYFAYGISGKMKMTSPDLATINHEDKVKFKNSTEYSATEIYVKPFDAGANFTVGYELKMGLQFSVNYSLGLVNTSPYKNEKEKNRYLGVSVGYLFKR